MIRLAIVSYNFRPVWAGPVERFIRYCPGLRKRGVDVTFFTPMRAGQRAEEVCEDYSVVRVGKEMEPPSVDTVHRRIFWRIFFSSNRWNAVLFLELHPFDIPWLWLLRLRGIKTIYVSTMALTDRRENGELRSPLRQKILDFLTRALHQSLTWTVSSTQALRSDFERINVDAKKLAVIPNGVSRVRFSPVDQEEKLRLRRELGLPVGEKVALFVGLMVERKGVLPLVNAWRAYRANAGDGFLVLVGDEQREISAFHEFYKEWDLTLAKVNERDQILIRPAHKKIEDYFRAADLFVFPSEVEGMPNVFLEAMSCGLPILTREFRGFSSELGRAGQEFEFLDKAPEKWSSQLKGLLENKHQQKSLSENGICWISENADVEKSLDAYVKLFQ